MTISLDLEPHVTASNYIISYSNTNTDCFNTSTGTIAVAASETMYTLNDLQEGTEYSITVTALVDGRTIEESLSTTTITTC